MILTFRTYWYSNAERPYFVTFLVSVFDMKIIENDIGIRSIMFLVQEIEKGARHSAILVNKKS